MLVPAPPVARRTSAVRQRERQHLDLSGRRVVIVIVTRLPPRRCHRRDPSGGHGAEALSVWPSRLRPYGRHFCSAIREECVPGWPFSQLAVRARHDEPAARAPRSGVEMAVSDPGRGASDDPGRGARSPGLLAIYRDADVSWGWFALSAARHRARPHGQQPDERPVRPRGRHRPRGLPPQPLLAASGAVRRDHPQGPRRCAPSWSTRSCLAIMIVLTVGPGLADRRASRSAASCSRPPTPRRRCG